MRVILNSDILHTAKPAVSGLPGHLDAFCRQAAAVGAILVLPRTSSLEDQRHRANAAQELATRVEAAIRLLQSVGADVPTIDVQRLTAPGDLLTALKATGIQVESEDPTLEDYRNAEERACLHLSPHPPDKKSDEMRDLIIWEVALRFARKDGKAMILSRDEVHSHARGEEEANAVGLLRAASVDDALEQLGRETPAGLLSRQILALIWSGLHEAALPLPKEVHVKAIQAAGFTADELGHANGRLEFTAESERGIIQVRVDVSQTDPNTISVHIVGVQVAHEPVELQTIHVTVPGELPRITSPEKDRLAELRRIVGGAL